MEPCTMFVLSSQYVLFAEAADRWQTGAPRGRYEAVFGAALLIEAMRARVCSTALKQHVMAIHVPGFRHGHGAAMALKRDSLCR
jgi:hypothetical protein